MIHWHWETHGATLILIALLALYHVLPIGRDWRNRLVLLTVTAFYSWLLILIASLVLICLGEGLTP